MADESKVQVRTEQYGVRITASFIGGTVIESFYYRGDDAVANLKLAIDALKLIADAKK